MNTQHNDTEQGQERKPDRWEERNFLLSRNERCKMKFGKYREASQAKGPSPSNGVMGKNDEKL